MEGGTGTDLLQTEIQVTLHICPKKLQSHSVISLAASFGNTNTGEEDDTPPSPEVWEEVCKGLRGPLQHACVFEKLSTDGL